MAITISGQNNNDKILASDGVLDQISGFNVVGVLTASTFETTGEITANHIDVGSTIQLGNAGIITATTLIGNVTGNVNSTSNLLFQISGSEKFRVGNGGQLGIGGANYGTSGQVLTSGGSSSAATWSTISGTTINNNANNRVITGSGTANTLEGESNLTFSGNTLDVNNIIKLSDAGFLKFGVSNTAFVRGKDDTDGYLQLGTVGAERLRIDSTGRLLLGSGAIALPKGSAAGSFDLDNGNITMCIGGNSNSTGRTNSTDKINRITSPHYTNAEEPVALLSSFNISGSNSISYGGGSGQTNAATRHIFYTAANTTTTTGTERLRIDSSGRVFIGGVVSADVGSDNLVITEPAGGYAGMTLRSAVTNPSQITFANQNTTFAGCIQYDNSSNFLRFFLNGANERLRIDNTGWMGAGQTSRDHVGQVAAFKNTSNTNSWLSVNVNNNTGIGGIVFGDSDTWAPAYIQYNHSGNFMQFITNGSERFRINNDGTVYFSNNIASASPSGQFGFRMDRGGGNSTSLHVENLNNDSVNNNAEVRLVTNHSNCRIVHHNQGGFYIIQSASGYLHYYQNGVSRVYIDQNGRVGVNYTGTAGWAEQLQVRGTYGVGEYAIAAQISHSSGSLMRFGTSSGVCGSISGSGTSTSFNTSSDYRLKENDVKISDGITRLKQLRPIRFNWKSDSSSTEDGFFAHEVSPVVPESVTGEKDAEIDEIGAGYQSIDHSKLVPLLTAALQEAVARIEALEGS